MKKEDIRVYTAQELEAMRQRGEDKTDWDRVLNMTEEELERSIADDPDWRDFKPDWENSMLFDPSRHEMFTMPMEREVIDWFREQGGDWQARIRDALRSYVEQHGKDAA